MGKKYKNFSELNLKLDAGEKSRPAKSSTTEKVAAGSDQARAFEALLDPPAAEAAAPADSSSHDLFASMLAQGTAQPTREKPTASILNDISLKEELAQLKDELSRLKEELSTVRTENEDLTAQLAAIATENAQLEAERDEARMSHLAADHERRTLQRKLSERGLATLDAEDETTPQEDQPPTRLAEPPSDVRAEVLLEAPTDFAEKFPGELREHVLATLADAHKSASQPHGRERRAQCLSAVLALNRSDGSLAARRVEVERIIREAGSFIGPAAIERFKKIGFESVSGKKHNKLIWGNITIMTARTPSDYRGVHNATQEFCNRCF